MPYAPKRFGAPLNWPIVTRAHASRPAVMRGVSSRNRTGPTQLARVTCRVDSRPYTPGTPLPNPTPPCASWVSVEESAGGCRLEQLTRLDAEKAGGASQVAACAEAGERVPAALLRAALLLARRAVVQAAA